jgi:hypothetical protein
MWWVSWLQTTGGGSRIECGRRWSRCCRSRHRTRWAVIGRAFRTGMRWTQSCWCCGRGMQWNALDATGVCSCSSAYRRFREWAEAGVFLEFWRQGLLAYDAKHGIEWEWLAMDGALGKAPLGGELTGPNPTDRAKKGRNGASSPRVRASRSGSRLRART